MELIDFLIAPTKKPSRRSKKPWHSVFEIMTALPPEADKNLCGRTEVGPSPPCRTGNFQAIKLLRGQHRHVIYRWKALIVTDNKGLHSNIFGFVNSFYKKKCRRTTLCQGGQHLNVARPAGVLFFFLKSVEHWWHWAIILPFFWQIQRCLKWSYGAYWAILTIFLCGKSTP